MSATDGFQYGVSLYSYMHDFGTITTLEDTFADIADLGATGVEILGEGHIRDYPRPTPAWTDRWFELLERYSLTPTNYGSWIDTRMWVDRDMTAKEGHEFLLRDLELAARLGFKFIRPKIGVVSMDLQPHPIWDEAVERTLERAAELDVVICPEIHTPTPIKSKVVDDYISFIQRTGTKHFGILIDTGIFQVNPLPTPPEYEGKELPPWAKPLNVAPRDLLDIMDYVVFFQAKFFDIDDNLVDQHIPWDEIVPVLIESGYAGFLSSEYEGERAPGREAEQLRRQHALIRRIEGAVRGALVDTAG